MGSGPLLLFDLDDTLVPNDVCYNRAKVAVLEQLFDRLQWKAPSPSQFLDYEEALDASKVSRMGYAPERFISSQDESAAHFFAQAGVEYTQADSEEFRKLGARAFSSNTYRRIGPIKGAIEAVQFARRQGASLRLVTKGTRSVQQQKIKSFKIGSLFAEEEIHILDEKTSVSLDRIVGDADKARTWKIGNMIKSDVMPALQIGIGAVYIPRETWLHETRDTPTIPADARVITIPAITHFASIYEQL